MKSINSKDKLEEINPQGSVIHETIEPSLLTCCLCHKKYTGFGNNAQPLATGLCCDACNFRRVLPARISQIIISEGASKKEVINSNNQKGGLSNK